MMKVCVEECVAKGIEVLGDNAFCGFSNRQKLIRGCYLIMQGSIIPHCNKERVYRLAIKQQNMDNPGADPGFSGGGLA